MSAGLQATGGVTLRRALAMGLLALVMAGCGGSSRPASESAGQAPAAGAESTAAAAESTAAGEAGPATTAAEAAPPAQPKLAARMDPDEVRSLLARNADVLLLDVRQPEEWTPPLGHIEGATLIPLPELRARLGEIDAWRDRPVVTVCRSGNRSETARRVLLEAGFTNVANMDGGMIEWRRTE
jgi:rhodanese-related sulfurtransferase